MKNFLHTSVLKYSAIFLVFLFTRFFFNIEFIPISDSLACVRVLNVTTANEYHPSVEEENFFPCSAEFRYGSNSLEFA